MAVICFVPRMPKYKVLRIRSRRDIVAMLRKDDECPFWPEDIMEGLGRRTHTHFGVYCSPGNLVGIAELCLRKDTLIFRHLYVLPEYRRHGVGTELVKCVKSFAISHPCTDVYVYPMQESQHFWKVMGLKGNNLPKM